MVRIVQRKSVVILNQNTVVKMFKFNNCSKKILQLELTIEHQQNQMDELRSIVLSLVTEIDKLQKQIHILTENKYGKSI